MGTYLPMIQQALLEGKRPDGFRMMLPPPIATLLGFEPVSIEGGATVFRLKVDRSRHANPMGTLHGGVMVDLADAAMGMACASLLEEGESFTTVELKVNFFRPVVDGEIEARAKVVNQSKTLVYLECDVVTIPGEKLVAKTNSSCLVLRGDQARGR